MICVTAVKKKAEVIRKKKKKPTCLNTELLMEIEAEPSLKQNELTQNSSYMTWLREQLQMLPWILSSF